MEKRDIDLAKVGFMALFDETVEYQYAKKFTGTIANELRCKLKDLRDKKGGKGQEK